MSREQGAFRTVAEAATEANRHPVTVRKALEAGELHGYQRVVGGRWSLEEGCISAWVRGQKCQHRTNVTEMRGRRSA